MARPAAYFILLMLVASCKFPKDLICYIFVFDFFRFEFICIWDAKEGFLYLAVMHLEVEAEEEATKGPEGTTRKLLPHGSLPEMLANISEDRSEGKCIPYGGDCGGKKEHLW